MATQRLTLAKLGGAGGNIALKRISVWAAARTTKNQSDWSSEQWPEAVRREVDDFADRLRAHGCSLPVVFFVEWTDSWSMGDILSRWLTPPDGDGPMQVYGNRYEVLAYSLPDGGRLTRYLMDAEAQQFSETDWFISRLREAIKAGGFAEELAPLIVLRYVVGPSATDKEVAASLRKCPDWLADGETLQKIATDEHG